MKHILLTALIFTLQPAIAADVDPYGVADKGVNGKPLIPTQPIKVAQDEGVRDGSQLL